LIGVARVRFKIWPGDENAEKGPPETEK